ncbi:cytidine deaminase [Ruminiclostridium cellulolyticum]|uniref:Cytidine deaminase n=1 Tax=Ruminiclostridium cellulolyticum (strain ATCC 35319 / DSM 5812 / JCM 6584 / H10) TaxID=394503 RepID=B8I735_RUMCH|nr:cytidine deaminase [Ruminiclostridium cellulolyticum]ACL74959.1 cytidine deaminase [Ruminiclostridium cellulolyticum H10]
MTEIELASRARKAMDTAYAPYSKFRVGAALLTASGRVYTGCNIEIASFGATNCAERTAIFKAVSEEGRIKIDKIAIASDDEDYIYPCGICRQVMAEFADDEMELICTRKNGEYKKMRFGDLLPNAFRTF